ncbi:TPA: glycosyltransferase [Raoultella ornithinolytica]|nr:glycosyltransferase [Raoultella ornithinolytica]
MNVLHIAETVKGGVATVINSLMECNEINSFVICPEAQSKEIYSEKKITFTRTGRDFSSLFSLWIVVFKTIKKNKFDVIHLHSSFSGFIVRFMFLLRMLDRKKYRVIYTPHCLSFMMDIKMWKKQIYKYIEILLSGQTDFIVANSHYEYKCAQSAGLNKEILRVVYNAVSLDGQLKTDIISSQNSIPVSPRKMNVLFVGRFDRQKGYDYLLDIIKKTDSSKFNFSIVGDAVHDNFERIEKENVRYYGWVNNKELPAHFSSNDILLMPSRWESFGLVAVEAQMYGLPVIANNVASLPEVVVDNITGMLVDYEDINKVIEILNRYPISFWNNKREECQSFVAKNFKKSDMVRKYIQLYNTHSSH